MVDERQFFIEAKAPEPRPARLQCPKCRRTNDYTIRWLRRTKKSQLPPGADERDRALFAKVKDHLVRVDDDVTCPTCRRRLRSRASGAIFPRSFGLPKRITTSRPCFRSAEL
jgi:hypothetical protein